jgi:hypothetical protein
VIAAEPAVDDAALVQVGQRAGHLCEGSDDDVAPCGAGQVGQRAAADVAGGEPRAPVPVVAAVDELDHAGPSCERQRGGLSPQPLRRRSRR